MDTEHDDDMTPEELAFLEEELLDADVAGAMGKLYLSNPKMQPAIEQGSKNPKAAALAVTQTLLETRNKMMSKGYPFSPRIWDAENGVLPEMIEAFARMSQMNGKPLDTKFLKDTHAESRKLLSKFDEAGQKKPEPAPAEPAPGKPDIYMQQPRGALG